MNTPHHTSTSKHHTQHHFRKQHHNSIRYHHMQHRNNYVGISYKFVRMMVARYEMLNRQSDFTIIYDVNNAYKRSRYGITIQPKDFKTMWVPKSQPIRLKTIWVPKTSP